MKTVRIVKEVEQVREEDSEEGSEPSDKALRMETNGDQKNPEEAESLQQILSHHGEFFPSFRLVVKKCNKAMLKSGEFLTHYQVARGGLRY